MTPTLLWILPALVALASGWLVSAWFHKRKIDALQAHHKAARQTEAERASQVKRQIAQLQAELAARPPLRGAAPAPAPAAGGRDARADAAAAEARRALVDKLVPDYDFGREAIASDGFASTEVMATVPGSLR